jgi:hypothetical protein
LNLFPVLIVLVDFCLFRLENSTGHEYAHASGKAGATTLVPWI